MLTISDPTQCKVALLAGGTSGERDISLNSGKGASKALKEAGFNVTQLDPAEKEDLVRLITDDFDVAFLCLHGKGGEDGALQGFLETIGLPYVGSGVLASASAIDKGKAKLVYEHAGLKTPPSVIVKRGEVFHVKHIAEIVGEHSVVKAPT